MITGSVHTAAVNFSWLLLSDCGSGPMDLKGLQIKQVGQERMSCVQNAWEHMASLL